jgi:hypothetical protein
MTILSLIDLTIHRQVAKEIRELSLQLTSNEHRRAMYSVADAVEVGALKVAMVRYRSIEPATVMVFPDSFFRLLRSHA